MFIYQERDTDGHWKYRTLQTRDESDSSELMMRFLYALDPFQTYLPITEQK